MDLSTLKSKEMKEQNEKAKEKWGHTEAYEEFEEKSKDWKEEDLEQINREFMKIFELFGSLKEHSPSDQEVQEQVTKLQTYITEHFYTCTNEILAGLGKMYGSGGEFSQSIDNAGGSGTAKFVEQAIEVYCSR